jgi:hypothetical protein
MSDFYEEDEDPATILAIFEHGEKGATGRQGYTFHLSGWTCPTPWVTRA